MLLDVGRHTLDDLVGVTLVAHDVSVQVAGRAELELRRVVLLVLLDGDFACVGEMLVLIPHQLDEIFQFLDFLRLQTTNELTRETSSGETYHLDP